MDVPVTSLNPKKVFKIKKQQIKNELNFRRGKQFYKYTKKT